MDSERVNEKCQEVEIIEENPDSFYALTSLHDLMGIALYANDELAKQMAYELRELVDRYRYWLPADR